MSNPQSFLYGKQKIHVSVLGRDESNVLLHYPGYGARHEHYFPYLSNLHQSLGRKNKHTIISLDYNTGTFESYRSNDIAEILLDVVHGMGIKKASLMGFSLGSYMAMYAASNSDIAKTVMLDSPVQPGDYASPVISQTLTMFKKNMGHVAQLVNVERLKFGLDTIYNMAKGALLNVQKTNEIADSIANTDYGCLNVKVPAFVHISSDDELYNWTLERISDLQRALNGHVIFEKSNNSHDNCLINPIPSAKLLEFIADNA
jgi:pimeloyl-ACP methyl ester carboxylesterase